MSLWKILFAFGPSVHKLIILRTCSQWNFWMCFRDCVCVCVCEWRYLTAPPLVQNGSTTYSHTTQYPNIPTLPAPQYPHTTSSPISPHYQFPNIPTLPVPQYPHTTSSPISPHYQFPNIPTLPVPQYPHTTSSPISPHYQFPNIPTLPASPQPTLSTHQHPHNPHYPHTHPVMALHLHFCACSLPGLWRGWPCTSGICLV